MVRTVQMLARWAANPRIIASKTAKTRIAMLHAVVGRPVVRAMEPGAMLSYGGAVSRFNDDLPAGDP